MGVFAVDVRVARPGRRPRWRTFRRVMVDTLLGARTLEGFNALVDARKKKLVATGPIPAAGAVS